MLYFYPKDKTPGCTLEGQDFRDLHAAFKKAGTLVLGVSKDSVASHEKFRDKMKFPFDLLSDEDEKVCELFDVWKEKSMYGRKFMGIERSTFLIDAGGVLRQEWRKVKVQGHADEVLDAAQVAVTPCPEANFPRPSAGARLRASVSSAASSCSTPTC